MLIFRANKHILLTNYKIDRFPHTYTHTFIDTLYHVSGLNCPVALNMTIIILKYFISRLHHLSGIKCVFHYLQLFGLELYKYK